MGREIKRVPLNFDWPMDKTWTGFLQSQSKAAQRFPRRAPRECADCGGTGYNRHTRRIEDDFYDFAGTGRRWVDKITQDEADALVAHGRLWDLWRRFGPNGWEDIEPRPRVTAEQVNALNRPGARGFDGHDGINRWILIETRARRLGVYGKCPRCRGEGSVFRRPGDRKRWDRWQPTPVPKGKGWQVWETVSEGSPVSPVFATPIGLEDWLVSVGGYERKAARAFVKGAWAPSGMAVDGHFYSGIEACGVMGEGDDGADVGAP